MKNNVEILKKLSAAAKKASFEASQLDASSKSHVLSLMIQALKQNIDEIISANQKDIDLANERQLTPAMTDRLLLNSERVGQMCQALHDVIKLNDPIGEISNSTLRPNGIRVSKMRIPLGVIFMIYESRPNVAVEAAALALKAGNSIILRGGKEAFYTNQALIKCWHQALAQLNLNPNTISMVTDLSYEAIHELLTHKESIDLVIPRGGEKLIEMVSDKSKIPVIQHYKGVCHLYVDKDANLKQAANLLHNGKVSRPGVCNSLETLLIHKTVIEEFSKQVNEIIEQDNLAVKVNGSALKYFPTATKANHSDYHHEHLCLALNIKVVDSFADAIQHIQTFSSNHTEVIATDNIVTANEFIKQINSSVVMVNASSRFSDGGELGLGAEIGISTSKLHAYGPMGHYELTTEKYIVTGQGQIRE